MDSGGAWRTHWPLAVFAALLGLLGLLVWRLPEDHTLATIAEVLLVAVPAVWVLVQWAYDRVDGFRLQLTRLRYWVGNQQMRWSFQGEFILTDGDDVGLAWKAAQETVTSHCGEGDGLVAEGLGQMAWHLSGLTLRLERDALHTGRPILRAHWMELPRSYRVWRTALGRTVVPLLDELERSIDVEEVKYVVRTRFAHGNPYYGLLIARHREDVVHRFDIIVKSRVGIHESNVRITADGIEIVGFNLHAVHQAARRYLALGAIGGESDG